MNSTVRPQDSGQMEEYNPTAKGPIKHRSCTDVICLILFIIFFAAFIAVGIWAYLIGDVNQLLYPVDSLGNFCGHGEFSDRPYVFYFDITRCTRVGYSLVYGCPTPAVCVEQCPSKDFTFLSNINSQDYICKYHINPSSSLISLYELVVREDCAAYYFRSTPIVGRCFPQVVTDFVVSNANNDTISPITLQQGLDHLTQFVDFQMIGTRVVDDLAKSWIIILIFFGIAILLCYLIIIIMRWVAGPIVLLCILLFVGFFGFATYYCFNKYFYLKGTQENNGTIEIKLDLQYYIDLYQTWLVLGIIAAIFLGISLLVILVLRTRLRIAVALIKESSRAIGAMMFTLLWPIFPLALEVVVFAYWLASTLYLASTGKAEYGQFHNDSNIVQEIPCNPEENSTAGSVCYFVQYGGNLQYAIVLQLFQLFMWLWVLNFVLGFGQLTLAGAFASYYWSFDKRKDLPLFPLTSSFGRSCRYHLGSVAFGSLLIAIVQMIRILLEFLDRRLKGAENRLAKFLVKCLKCCFWCLEKFIKFISRNAYIMIAVAGKNFCVSAKNAFSLILRNILRAAVLDGVTDFLLFLCKLFVVGGIGVLSFFFFSGELAKAIPSSWFSDWLKQYQPSLSYYLVPVAIIVIGTFVIASLFFNVFNMAVDTLFLCFLEDLERNDGSAEKPYFMNKELLKILGKRNERYKDIKDKVKPASKKSKRKKKKKDEEQRTDV